MVKTHHPVIIIIWVLLALPAAVMWIVPQPKQNIWVTLAKTLQEDSLCMSMGSVNDPLSTCLVGIPLTAKDYLYAGKKANPVDTWDEWTKILPIHQRNPKNWTYWSPPRLCTVSNFIIGDQINIGHLEKLLKLRLEQSIGGM